MSRIKLILAVLVVAAIAVPVASATYVPTVLWIGGSSAEWQTMALGAYNAGHNYLATGTNPSPNASTCHYSQSSGVFNLTDTRQGNGTVDSDSVWVVWSVPHNGANTAQQDCTDAHTNNSAALDVWVFVKVDSVVGVRCYFARPACGIAGPAALPAPNNKILSALWGDGSTDSTPSAAVQSFLHAGAVVNVAATDIRPEDAAFAECRVNSDLGNSAQASGHMDGLDGLGYQDPGATQNGAGHSGVCPHYTGVTNQDLLNSVGQPILTGIPGSTKKANVLAFNITGKDPLTNTTVPAATTYAVGAAPIVFIVNNTNSHFDNVTNATEQQLQTVFSGTNCNASVFTHGTAGAINVFLREPLSGTYNTTEATVMRYPTAYGTGGVGVIGTSMETGVGTNNPVKDLNCAAGGGSRFRGIGTGEEVGAVHDSANAAIFNGGANGTAKDGIGFTFFSFGNVSTITAAAYKYLQLNGVDPIWASYSNGFDTAQSATAGALPTGGATGVCERDIWAGGFSFPNLRNGTYRAWSNLRMISTGTAGGQVAKLITASNKYVVTTVPDYVPAVSVAITGSATSPCGTVTFTDKGMGFIRSHYQQKDGAGTLLGVAPVNEPTTAEKGGDMGGMIIPTQLGTGVATATVKIGEKQVQIVQGTDNDNNLGPYKRP